MSRLKRVRVQIVWLMSFVLQKIQKKQPKQLDSIWLRAPRELRVFAAAILSICNVLISKSRAISMLTTTTTSTKATTLEKKKKKNIIRVNKWRTRQQFELVFFSYMLLVFVVVVVAKPFPLLWPFRIAYRNEIECSEKTEPRTFVLLLSSFTRSIRFYGAYVNSFKWIFQRPIVCCQIVSMFLSISQRMCVYVCMWPGLGQ